jgi:hypothetical protein
MGTISGDLDITITGSGGGNPLPFALVTAEALTAASTPGVYTGAATDLGTVAACFTIAVTASSASFTPDVTLPAWQPDGVELSSTNPAPVATADVTLEGSLDGDSWYALATTSAAVATPDGSTAAAVNAFPAVTATGSPLARYIRSVITFELNALYSVYENPYTSYTVTSASLTVSVAVGVQL